MKTKNNIKRIHSEIYLDKNLIENNYFNQTEEIHVKDKKNSKSNFAEIFNKRYISYINDYFLLKVKGFIAFVFLI